MIGTLENQFSVDNLLRALIIGWSVRPAHLRIFLDVKNLILSRIGGIADSACKEGTGSVFSAPKAILRASN